MRSRLRSCISFANVVSMLALWVSGIVLAGVLLTPWFVDLVAPGFHGELRDLTVRIVRVLFPGARLLVLSALLALVVGGCADDSSNATSPNATASPTTTIAAVPTVTWHA